MIDDESTTSRNTDDLSIQLCRNAKSAVLDVIARHHVVRIASVSVAVKPVGKLDVRNRPVQFDERGRETTDGLLGPGQAPFLDSTAVLSNGAHVVLNNSQSVDSRSRAQVVCNQCLLLRISSTQEQFAYLANTLIDAAAANWAR